MSGFRGGMIPAGARFVVWFDHPRDCLCFGSRVGLEQGEPIPEERIVRIPLKLGEDFIEVAMNAATSAAIMGDGEADYNSVMHGIQALLDQRMLSAIELADGFRTERSRAVGGGAIDSPNTTVAVNGGEYAKLILLKDRMLRKDVVFSEAAERWMEEHGFYES